MQDMPSGPLRFATADVARQLFACPGSLHPMLNTTAVIRKMKDIGTNMVRGGKGLAQLAAYLAASLAMQHTLARAARALAAMTICWQHHTLTPPMLFPSLHTGGPHSQGVG